MDNIYYQEVRDGEEEDMYTQLRRYHIANHCFSHAYAHIQTGPTPLFLGTPIAFIVIHLSILR
jgi:hypothetical protein